MDYVKAIEIALEKKGKIDFKPMQPGDLPTTYADADSLYDYIGFKPATTIQNGVKKFVEFYLEYHKKEINTF